MEHQCVLVMTGVSRVFVDGDSKVHALDAVNLAVSPGELVAVTGASGSGKSTLLAVAGGLDAAFTGSVVLRGLELQGLSPDRASDLRLAHVGFVFQEYNLVPTLTAAENVALPLLLRGEGVKAAESAARTALTDLGLADVADRAPDRMSGGQRQRVAVARALATRPSIVLADEPTGALDAASGELVEESLRALTATGIAAVVATHNAELAARADRVLVMADGVLTAGR